MDFWSYLLLLVAGVIAGVMNTVGGGGSVLTLPALIFFGGLTGPDANATNRIGIMAQNVMAISRFRKGGIKEDRIAGILVLAGLPGAGVGALLAAWIPEKSFNYLLAVIMLALLALILLKPKPKLLKESDGTDAWGILSPQKKVTTFLVIFAIGVYMGFLQAGAGIMVLVALGYLMRLDLVRGNYIKLVLILVLNVLAFSVFLWGGLNIAWIAGFVMFAGQMGGAYIGSWVALEKGEGWIKAILVVSIILSSAKLLGILDWAWALLQA